MLTYMFPGQGSQARGMGKELFDRFPELTAKADKVLGYSIKELCIEDPRRELNKTQFTQPALYTVNALSYYAKLEDTGVKPDFLLGHSLGEFNALLAAGCFDFEAGLKVVKKRAELMSQAPKGAMAAILNTSADKIKEILKENGLNNIDLANYNAATQIVISGDVEEITNAQHHFQDDGMMYVPLNTSGAFHSRFMIPSKEKFEVYLKRFKFLAPEIPVISNVTARPYQESELIDNLALQLASCVRWYDSVRSLLQLAQEKNETLDFVEVGPGDVLTKITARNKADFAKENRAKNSQPQVVSAAAVKDADQPPTALSAADLVAGWNSKNAIGTKCKSSLIGPEKELETRTQAVVLFGHRAAVYMKGYNGYFDLKELELA